jgi:uncharacterized membrane protein YhhN
MAIAATTTKRLPLKMGVPISCGMILGGFLSAGLLEGRDTWWVVAGLLFSAAGDFFISRKEKNEALFVVGIGLYLFAHLGYLTTAWRNGGVNLMVLGPVLAVYVVYFYALLRPAIADPVLRSAVLVYLLVSCVALGVASGLEWEGAPKALFVAGILLIVISDTAISLEEFLKVRGVRWLILPTYYLAHLAISAGLLLRGHVVG